MTATEQYACRTRLKSQPATFYPGKTFVSVWHALSDGTKTVRVLLPVSRAFVDDLNIELLFEGEGTYYKAEINSNYRICIDHSKTLVARYLYDLFVATIAFSDPLAQANLYCFTSKLRM